ncbi:RNA pyrophosphohydrolase [Pseudovibrio axinellae]|uniref:RNA pyrophosphohydrolase n=1 Tax=Pseudovibrio axinellae TaxID=989403 RepID=A0A165YYR9_9HYPH|nr:RNA pyrophosphohydrolase [Pseudovibrio axinellae]KZL19356.1 RNA pyrophosphohydrolase [Pseudovibrio axinellae]SEQ39930.1 putative (di)nucleoside polyphosphate hydrolase [Pseudovibrio axinellae]
MTDYSALPFRQCVGIMLINRDGFVWAGKRYGDEQPIPDEYAWQMPQGGLDKGENPIAAAKRELYEETSVKSISLLAEAPDWFSYDFPEDVQRNMRKVKYRGQTQRWFAFRFDGDDSEINILTPPDGHAQEFCEWRWEKAENLPGLVIPFKQQVYRDVVEVFSEFTV